MKNLTILALSLFLITDIHAATRVSGYYRSNGTYVQPHYRSSPNSTTSDNWSVRPNVNPYTGKIGTKSPDYSSSYTPIPSSSYTPPIVNPEPNRPIYESANVVTQVIPVASKGTETSTNTQAISSSAQPTQPAKPKTWIKVGATNSDAFFLNIKSVKDEILYKGAWVKTTGVLNSRGVVNWGGNVLTKLAIDCNQGRYSIMSKQTYNSKGELVQQWNSPYGVPANWEYAAPSTIVGDMLSEYICS